MAGIYFSSDWHGRHLNLVRGTSSWEDKRACRDFDTVEEHDETLIQNINNKVSWDSTIYFLGDFTFQGIENIWKFRDRINCQTIHFVAGNHDHHQRKNAIVKTDAGYKNVQSLFASYNEIISKKIGGQQMTLCHYPMRSWEKASKGAWMLFGHCHNALPDYVVDGKVLKTMDVGVDGAADFAPYHFEEIRSIMDKRKILIEGHHV